MGVARSMWFLYSLLLLVLRMRVVAAQDPFCRRPILTPSDEVGPFYRPNSPFTDRIAPENQLNNPSKLLVIMGHVIGRNCEPVADAVVEVWYAGEPDQEGNYYQDTNYRGQVRTGECGEFNLSQTFPAIYPQRPIAHNHFRISKDGSVLLATQMYFVGFITDVIDEQRRLPQIVNVTQDDSGVRAVNFNIFVDADGDAPSCNETFSNEPFRPGTSAPNRSASATRTAVVAALSLAACAFVNIW